MRVSHAAVAQGASFRSTLAGSATILGAMLLVLCEAAGETYVVLAVVLAALLLAWGWPHVTGTLSPLTTRVAILATAAASVLAVRYNSGGAPLRHFPVVLAIGVIIAFFGQLLRGDGRQRVSEGLIGDLAAVALVVSGMALTALPVVRAVDLPIALAMAGVALGVAGDDLAERFPGAALLINTALGALAGLGADRLFAAAAPLWAAAIVGALASLVATATRMAVRDLPGGRRAGMAAVTASAGLLAAGLVTYAMARLLLG
ncbi:hypothetical protein GCM10009810_27970 [Nostocoides vanveenii]|uniref:Uncharacterized protein n=1 Tax=Nostocoides vanveenii TaxID=330835 RepID=A0ABN2KXB6_9MICO